MPDKNRRFAQVHLIKFNMLSGASCTFAGTILTSAILFLLLNVSIACVSKVGMVNCSAFFQMNVCNGTRFKFSVLGPPQ